MEYLTHIIKRIRFHLTNYFKPLTVHTETIYFDSVWEEVKKRASRGEVHTWYVMTPANYEMFRAFFNVKLSKQQISKVMKERYLWLIKNGQRVQLHAHLTKLMNISYQEQEKLIRNSVEWFTKNLGFFPKEFVPGWWAYNKDTEKILSKLNIRLIKEEEFRATHDYNWIMN